MQGLPPPRNPWPALHLLDASLAFAAIGLCAVLCLRQMPAVLDKVRLTEVLIHLSLARGTGVERIALTGDASAGPAEPLDTFAPGGRFEYRRAGAGVLAQGRLRPDGQAFLLAFSPSLNEAEPWGHVMWACGRRPAVPGWSAPALPVAENLADPQLPFVCRNPAAP